MLAVRNFFSTSHFVADLAKSFYFHLPFNCHNFPCLIKFINESFYMRCLVMFITALCLLFLLKLKWPKNESVYDLFVFVLVSFIK